MNNEPSWPAIVLFSCASGAMLWQSAMAWDWLPGRWGLLGVWVFFLLLTIALRYGQEEDKLSP